VGASVFSTCALQPTSTSRHHITSILDVIKKNQTAAASTMLPLGTAVGGRAARAALDATPRPDVALTRAVLATVRDGFVAVLDADRGTDAAAGSGTGLSPAGRVRALSALAQATHILLDHGVWRTGCSFPGPPEIAVAALSVGGSAVDPAAGRTLIDVLTAACLVAARMSGSDASREALRCFKALWKPLRLLTALVKDLVSATQRRADVVDSLTDDVSVMYCDAERRRGRWATGDVPEQPFRRRR
jgi:hypothetical protein